MPGVIPSDCDLRWEEYGPGSLELKVGILDLLGPTP